LPETVLAPGQGGAEGCPVVLAQSLTHVRRGGVPETGTPETRKRTYGKLGTLQILFKRFSDVCARSAAGRAPTRVKARTTARRWGARSARPLIGCRHGRGDGGASDIRKCPKMSDLAKCTFGRAVARDGPAEVCGAGRVWRRSTIGHGRRRRQKCARTFTSVHGKRNVRNDPNAAPEAWMSPAKPGP
jgi:hypothetical protein